MNVFLNVALNIHIALKSHLTCHYDVLRKCLRHEGSL